VSGVVVDTSFWIDYLGGKSTPILDDVLRQGSVLLPPVVLAELISGAHRPRERAALMDFLSDLALCDTDRAHWIRVGDLRRRCREKGLSVSTPDAHVAQCALDVDAPLLSYARIFAEIARQTNLRLIPRAGQK
jgi:predicted nucleic acid-binding protein